MSSNMASLSKRTSESFKNRSVPYRNFEPSATASVLQNDSSKIKGIDSPTDIQLMSKMVERISLLEAQLKHQTKELIEKDSTIEKLQTQCKCSQNYSPTNEKKEAMCLKKQNEILVNQISEMESFLADYGLMWVGGSESEPNSESNWCPQSSTIKTVNYDKIIENIKDLNILAGDGTISVKSTQTGATFETKERVNLTLYSNGIFMFNGPFRPFEDLETMICIKDFEDGYFPSELQSRYPNGVIFNVSDKRSTEFKQRHNGNFSGNGHKVGSVLPPDNQNKITSNNETQCSERANIKYHNEVDNIPSRLTVEQFLNNLPNAVIKNNKVINIRSDIGKIIKRKQSATSEDEEVIDTEVVRDIKSRLSSHEICTSSMPRKMTTLRVKSESGNKTFILKMKSSDTVKTLRSYIDKKRGISNKTNYDILTSIPGEILNKLEATMEECGLIPNAILRLRLRKH